MSNYLSRNSKMPDTSLQPRENFTLKQIVVAFVLVVVIVGIGTALAIALSSNREQVLQTAINEAKTEKSRFETAAEAVTAREAELDARERALNNRETELKTAEAALTQRETDLALARAELDNNKVDFAEHQNRVYALAKALHEELDPDYAGKTIYVDSADPDLLIEEYEEPLE